MTKTPLVALIAVLTVLTGCAGPDSVATTPPGPASASPPGSASASPAPSGDSPPAETIVGTVNRGGSGPCYGLITEEGVQYALYEGKGRALATGVRVTVEAVPSRLRIDCGEGTLVEVKALTPLS